ncbi:MAG: T9SS type A sorting domain-containing protein [Bacteroidales bacterium]|nr:T9SS type A sorting domain-containing protein [Bacteroidales bacterium]
MRTKIVFFLWVLVSAAFSQTQVNLAVKQLDDLSYSLKNSEVTIAKGESVVLASDLKINGGTGTYEYYWFPTNMVDNATLEKPTTKPDKTTSYYQTITDGNDCRLYLTYNVIVKDDGNGTSIPELRKETINLSLSPNPAQEKVTVTLKGEPTNAPIYISISDNTGKIVYLKSINSFSGSEKIPFSLDISQGVYLVTAQGSTMKITEQLFVE